MRVQEIQIHIFHLCRHIKRREASQGRERSRSRKGSKEKRKGIKIGEGSKSIKGG